MVGNQIHKFSQLVLWFFFNDDAGGGRIFQYPKPIFLICFIHVSIAYKLSFRLVYILCRSTIFVCWDIWQSVENQFYIPLHISLFKLSIWNQWNMTCDCAPREVPTDPKWRETIMCLANAVRKFKTRTSICNPLLILVLSVVHDSKSTKTKKFYHLPRALIWTNQNCPHG